MTTAFINYLLPESLVFIYVKISFLVPCLLFGVLQVLPTTYINLNFLLIYVTLEK